MRHADSKFYDTFVLIMGVLIGIAVGIFFLARAIAVDAQGTFVMADPYVQAAINERIKPVGHVAMLGDAELEAVAAAAAAPAAVSAPLSGPQVYNSACIVCHAPPGVGGAPPFGDAAAWGPRIAQGLETLREHALQGYQGNSGFMPAKGGRVDLSDEEVTLAIDYMVEQASQ